MTHHLPIGSNWPKIVNAVIEVPQGTHNKYEYDEELGVIRLDRALHSPLYYPFDYGFIPGTRSLDGDHLDVMVLTNSPVFPGCLLDVRPIGVLKMSDESGIDEKILAVPVFNPVYTEIKKLRHVSDHYLKEIQHFFSEYKRLEDKLVNVEGWANRLEAYKVIRACRKRYLAEQK